MSAADDWMREHGHEWGPDVTYEVLGQVFGPAVEGSNYQLRRRLDWRYEAGYRRGRMMTPEAFTEWVRISLERAWPVERKKNAPSTYLELEREGFDWQQFMTSAGLSRAEQAMWSDYLTGASPSEIAAARGWSDNTVKTFYKRGMAKLRAFVTLRCLIDMEELSYDARYGLLSWLSSKNIDSSEAA